MNNRIPTSVLMKAVENGLLFSINMVEWTQRKYRGEMLLSFNSTNHVEFLETVGLVATNSGNMVAVGYDHAEDLLRKTQQRLQEEPEWDYSDLQVAEADLIDIIWLLDIALLMKSNNYDEIEKAKISPNRRLAVRC